MIEVAPVPRTEIPQLLSLHQFLHRGPEASQASLGRLWYLEDFENPSGISVRVLCERERVAKEPCFRLGLCRRNWKPRKSVPKTVTAEVKQSPCSHRELLPVYWAQSSQEKYPGDLVYCPYIHPLFNHLPTICPAITSHLIFCYPSIYSFMHPPTHSSSTQPPSSTHSSYI